MNILEGETETNVFEIDETEPSSQEEMEVVTEIRMGLMLGEISPSMNKKQLKEWFASIQIKKGIQFCDNVTGQDLIRIATECGLAIEC